MNYQVGHDGETYTVYYSGEHAIDYAIEDAKELLGARKFELLKEYIEGLHDTPQGRQEAYLAAAYAGLDGYPVDAMCDVFMIPQKT